MLDFIKNLFDSNEREIRRLNKRVQAVNDLEPEIKKMSQSQLAAKKDEFKARIEAGESLDDLLEEAFAVVREAARRTVDMRPFDVQVMGGIVLHEGRTAEMKTGEGKTLVATMPAYLNALSGKGVHIITVNDYLAQRDREWMGKVYEYLGMEVGVITSGMEPEERKEAYSADITYGTNNEFGFDYLRDNMAFSQEALVQREYNYAILDEVDSILIDEARTPLIISGPSERSPELYYKFTRLVKRLERERDYEVDEKAKSVMLTDEGVSRVEELLEIDNLYDPSNMKLSHHLNLALRARELMHRDQDYLVKDGEVVIVDEFTGRLMPGRRYSEGLHQAIEAKEGVEIKRESQTFASITFQNYFRLYDKLAGMTGTAKTEEEELIKIYGMDVVVIPTNVPLNRDSLPDLIYKTEEAKFKAVVRDIIRRHRKGQPVLVGTVSIEKSEKLSSLLSEENIPHHVLNAKHHEKEAEIIAEAGQYGAVTIATNMAGRGTDIVLGDGVAELGGLHVIGTERHESRRIDNQLRGRAGRQGDPGSSQFYISLEDDLMRLFGSDRIYGMLDRVGMEDDQPIEHRMLTRAVENAQKKVESRNFDMRRHLLEYDNVMAKQREVIYKQRRKILYGEDLKENIYNMIAKWTEELIEVYCPEGEYPEEWELEALLNTAENTYLRKDQLTFTKEEQMNLTRESLRDMLVDSARENYEKREEKIGSDLMRRVERQVMLQVVDKKWMDHLSAMDHLKQGIGLRGYDTQSDPLTEYKFEAYDMFQAMNREIREEIIRYIYRVEIVRPQDAGLKGVERSRFENLRTNREEDQPDSSFEGYGVNTPGLLEDEEIRRQRERMNQAAQQAGEDQPVKPEPRRSEKVGRNEPCPCGSGRKYKYCCGG